MVVWKTPASSFLLVLALNVLLTGAVWELNKSNFEKFRKTASFPIFFVDSPSCSRCRLLYPFFYAASQVFREDREIFFGRVQDKSLIRQWNIEELPAILYYEKGETEWERLEGDITVDNIVATISRAIPGYIGDIKLHYSIEISDSNYDELVVTPKQNVILLTYNSDERHLRKVLENVAFAFRFDEQVSFCAIDADKYPKLLKKRFGHQTIPSVFWYEFDNKNNKFLFGAKHHPVTLLLFVNQKTNLWRRKDGYLEEMSGRIDKLDDLFKKYIPELLEVDAHKISSIIDEMKGVDLKHPWEHDFAEYYMELLERIAEEGHPLETLRNERNVITNMVDTDEDLTQKQQDFFLRKRNIATFMVQFIKKYVEDKQKKEEEERKRKLEEASIIRPGVITRMEEIKPEPKPKPKKKKPFKKFDPKKLKLLRKTEL